MPASPNGIRARDLRPCDACGGELGVIFHVLRHSLAVIDRTAAMQFMGTAMILGNNLALAEHMAPTDVVAQLGAELDGGRWLQILLCSSCYASKHGDTCDAFEREAERRDAATEAAS